MAPAEIEILVRYLEGSGHYFEYGMGGSTILASATVSGAVTAVESDPIWIAKVRSQITRTEIDVRLHHINIGPVGDWGYPLDNTFAKNFSSYSTGIDLTDSETVDFCLVDGRFRVASALYSAAKVRSDCIIAIHDYSVRPHYKVVETYLRRINSVQSLSFFVRRQSISRSALSAISAVFLNRQKYSDHALLIAARKYVQDQR
jgi:hypothetical protein